MPGSTWSPEPGVRSPIQDRSGTQGTFVGCARLSSFEGTDLRASRYGWQPAAGLPAVAQSAKAGSFKTEQDVRAFPGGYQIDLRFRLQTSDLRLQEELPGVCSLQPVVRSLERR